MEHCGALCFMRVGVWLQILTPLQCARFFHQCYPFGPDLMSLMAAAASEPSSPNSSDADAHRIKCSNSGTSPRSNSNSVPAPAEWRKALVLPLSRLRSSSPAGVSAEGVDTPMEG